MGAAAGCVEEGQICVERTALQVEVIRPDAQLSEELPVCVGEKRHDHGHGRAGRKCMAGTARECWEENPGVKVFAGEAEMLAIWMESAAVVAE